MFPLILAIESSCDDTAAAVIGGGEILSNEVATQQVHEAFGGVVPELASRAHQKNIIPVVSVALEKAQISISKLDAIAFTQGPGLLGSLLVGSTFAKSISLAQNIPLIGVNHMQAHITSHFIDEPKPVFPFLCLTVSGGHTQIVRVDGHSDMEVIGETQDDAVGEAFDKAAKMLGLPYPGGPLVDQYAKKGDPNRYSFPKTDVPEFDFSFSGIKTALLYFLRDKKAQNDAFLEDNLADICGSYQKALIDMLMEKLEKASHETEIKRIGIAGGVSANSLLRRRIREMEASHGWSTYIPKFEYCTDNAAMVAMNAHFKFLQNQFSDLAAPVMSRMKF